MTFLFAVLAVVVCSVVARLCSRFENDTRIWADKILVGSEQIEEVDGFGMTFFGAVVGIVATIIAAEYKCYVLAILFILLGGAVLALSVSLLHATAVGFTVALRLLSELKLFEKVDQVYEAVKKCLFPSEPAAQKKPVRDDDDMTNQKKVAKGGDDTTKTEPS